MRKRGGSLFHPYLASASPNMFQTLENQWNGGLESIPRSSNPVDYSWEFKTTNPEITLQSTTVSVQPSLPYIYSRGPSVSGPTASGGRRIRRTRRRKTRKTNAKKQRKSRK